MARTAACLLAALVLASSGGLGGASRIYGHIRSCAYGQPFGPRACNLPSPDIHLRFEGMKSHRFFQVTTDKAGAYSFDVPPDTYSVLYTWVDTGVDNRPIVKSRAPDYGPPTITVGAGDRLVADFSLLAGIFL